MSLLGWRATSVEFNFPISQFCADGLRHCYRQVTDLGPVDPSLPPREPGRYLGVLFSGGLDSTAVWAVLRDVLGDEFRVLTAEYGGHFEREREGRQGIHLHVASRTNLRARGYDQRTRFHMAVPLLFADYADLGSVATGHTFHQPPMSIESLAGGERPGFLSAEAAIVPAGLREEHIVRSLLVPGVLSLLRGLVPERVELALNNSAPSRHPKRVVREIMLKHALEEAGEPVPAFLQTIALPAEKYSFTAGPDTIMDTLYAALLTSVEHIAQMAGGIERYDFSSVEKLSWNFMRRYNTNISPLLPNDIRVKVLDAFHRCRVYPYDERDFYELGLVREFTENPEAYRKA
jgi:hypothetical protein